MASDPVLLNRKTRVVNSMLSTLEMLPNLEGVKPLHVTELARKELDIGVQGVKYLVHLYLASLYITPLCFLTMWHEEATRYRTRYGSPLNYTLEMPFVRESQMLVEHAEVLCEEVETAALLARGAGVVLTKGPRSR